MILLAYVVGSLALGAGTGLLLLALLRMEQHEPKGYVGKGWLREERRRRWR